MLSAGESPFMWMTVAFLPEESHNPRLRWKVDVYISVFYACVCVWEGGRERGKWRTWGMIILTIPKQEFNKNKSFFLKWSTVEMCLTEEFHYLYLFVCIICLTSIAFSSLQASLFMIVWMWVVYVQLFRVYHGRPTSSEPGSTDCKITRYIPRREFSQADGDSYPDNNMMFDSFRAIGGV